MSGEPYVKDKVPTTKKDTSDMKITENKARLGDHKDKDEVA